jgi:hypothetical protein
MRTDRSAPMTAELVAPAHVIELAGFAALALPVDQGGLELGVDRAGNSAILGLFDERGREVVAIGQAIAVLTALRAVATGALVRVDLTRRAAWQRLLEAEGGPMAELISIGETGEHHRPSFLRPQLVVGDPARRGTGGPMGPWTCMLRLIHDIDGPALATLRVADLILTGRLTRNQATAVHPVLRLSDEVVAILTTLPDWSVAVITGGRLAVLDISASPTEIHLLRLALSAAT